MSCLRAEWIEAQILKIAEVSFSNKERKEHLQITALDRGAFSVQRCGQQSAFYPTRQCCSSLCKHSDCAHLCANEFWRLEFKILIVRALMWLLLPHFWELTHSSLNVRHLWCAVQKLAKEKILLQPTACLFQFCSETCNWVVFPARCAVKIQDVSSNRPKNILPKQMHRSTEWKIAWLGFISTKNSCCYSSLFTHSANTCSALYFLPGNFSDQWGGWITGEI